MLIEGTGESGDNEKKKGGQRVGAVLLTTKLKKDGKVYKKSFTNSSPLTFSKI